MTPALHRHRLQCPTSALSPPRSVTSFGEPTVPGGSLAPLMDPPLIEIEGLTNRFDALTAVENGSFTVPRPRSRQGGATRNSV